MALTIFNKKISCSSCNKSISNNAFLQELHVFAQEFKELLNLELQNNCATCMQTLLGNACQNFADTYNAKHECENELQQYKKPQKLLEGIHYYTENGNFVFTKWHHLQRGYCCKNACRHCAYGYVKTS